MWGYRPGAKPNDINRIREMVEQGCEADQISRALLINEKCVSSFVEHFKRIKNKVITEKPYEPDHAIKGSAPDAMSDDLANKHGRKRLVDKLEGLSLP
jgi:hypothetical protein